MKHLLPLLLLIIATSLSNEIKGVSPRADKGIFDLREMTDEEFLLKLNGEWEFYWKKLLRPHNFQTENLKPDLYGKIPSYWTDYSDNSINTQGKGYATYKLTVLLPKGFRKPLGFDMPVFDSSYDLYINGEYHGGNGIPGKSAEETKPGYSRNLIRFEPDSDTLSIIINVANYSHRRGGFWLPVNIGTYDKLKKRVANNWAFDWCIFSLLLGFSLFFLFFFLTYPKEKAMLYFSLATIGLALRPLFTSHFLINNIITIDWDWIVRSEYLGLYLIITGFIWFTATVYPSKFFRLFAKITAIYFSISFILTFFLPVRIFSYNTMAIYPAIIILMSYAVYKSFRGILNKNSLDIIYFLTFILLIAGGMHDIRVSLGKSSTSYGYILSYHIVLFIIVQAALLLYKWVKSYSEKDKLQNELEFLNRNLESLVNERTEELKTQKEEIEKQNSRIAQQNKQLTETIHLKNKIFSVVAHDLRSPVVNILYMLNLLKEKENRDNLDQFTNSSIEYAQMVISLLENMLVWGRGQEDKIKYTPDRHNLADIILTNLSIFKETADEKEISMNFTQIGSSMAFIDKDLLDIVIRNLLSNAIKYTARGGRISILLKDKTDHDNNLMVKICDNGIGISEGKKKYLFTSKEIISTPGTENEKGTGLGLKLCYELILINKGSINVESTEGAGTCFSIFLPLK